MNLSFTLFRMRNRIEGWLRPQHTASHFAQKFLRPRRLPLKGWEQDAERQGQRISYADGLSALIWGEGPQKLLLVHGWESRATHFWPLAQELVNAGYQVIALDAPAHGSSAGQEANMPGFANAILAADRRFGPFTAVIGHSMGASATALAASRGLRSHKLVLIAGPSSVLGVLQRFSQLLGLPKRASQAFVRQVEMRVGVPAAELDFARWPQNPSTEVLIIHDQDDREVPFPEAEHIVRSWPQARLLPLHGFGHRKILRAPQIGEALRQFLPQSAAPLH